MHPRLNINETAEKTGASAACLRVWEDRYKWPKPKRLANGYRSYSRFDVEQIARVKRLVDAGTPVGEIIIDGAPVFPVEMVKRERPVKTDFAAIPQPSEVRARAIRRDLEESIKAKDAAGIREAIALLPTIRPSDRENAVHAVLRAAGVRL